MVDLALKVIDKQNMYDLIFNFHRQITAGIEIGQSANLGDLQANRFNNIILAGMGGSAIGGELLKSFLKSELGTPFVIHRNYKLPEYCGKDSLVICSSYSGNTEETLSAFEAALAKRCSMLCISTGGELSELARKNNVPLIRIPSGMMPRAALGYSFAPLLIIFGKLGLCDNHVDDLKSCADELAGRAIKYSFESSDNAAYEIARKLKGRIVVIYSGPDYFDAVALRFKGQISENGKQHAFCNVFPEFNHNELVGWELAPSISDKYIVIILRDDSDHPRVARRMDIVKKVLSGKGIEVQELVSEGSCLLSRMFMQIQMADFISYYLALLNGVDPTPIEIIEYLKNELSRE